MQVDRHDGFCVYVHRVFQPRLARRPGLECPVIHERRGNYVHIIYSSRFLYVFDSLESLAIGTSLSIFQGEYNENCLPIYWENLSVHALIKKDRWLRSSTIAKKLLLNNGRQTSVLYFIRQVNVLCYRNNFFIILFLVLTLFSYVFFNAQYCEP